MADEEVDPYQTLWGVEKLPLDTQSQANQGPVQQPQRINLPELPPEPQAPPPPPPPPPPQPSTPPPESGPQIIPVSNSNVPAQQVQSNERRMAKPQGEKAKGFWATALQTTRGGFEATFGVGQGRMWVLIFLCCLNAAVAIWFSIDVWGERFMYDQAWWYAERCHCAFYHPNLNESENGSGCGTNEFLF